MALRARDNVLSQGSENIGVANKAVVMGTRAQATANVTTRRRLADVSNANNAVGRQQSEKQPSTISDDAENKPPMERVSRKRSRDMILSPKNANESILFEATLKAQELKPALGLKKSLATRNLLATTHATASTSTVTTTTTATVATTKTEVKEPKEENSAAVAAVAKPIDAYSVNSLRTFIEDIDAADGDNPQLCAEYVKDIYEYLRHLEQEYAVRADYLTASAGSKVKPEINGKMRAILIDWLIQVHQRFSLLQETLYLTIAILDRYLSQRFVEVKRKKLQLVGVSCMWIASKYEEMYAPEINDFVYITDNAYSSLEIRTMELDVLRALDFNLGKPLPLHFLRRNSKAAGVDAKQHNFAKFFMEMTLQEYSFVHISPSELAAAALCLSCRVINEESEENDVKLKWEDKMVHYSGYEESSLEPLMSSIASFVVKSETSKLNFVKQKYQSSKFMRISASPLLKAEPFLAIAKTAESAK